jgi:hypothetical protein
VPPPCRQQGFNTQLACSRPLPLSPLPSYAISATDSVSALVHETFAIRMLQSSLLIPRPFRAAAVPGQHRERRRGRLGPRLCAKAGLLWRQRQRRQPMPLGLLLCWRQRCAGGAVPCGDHVPPVQHDRGSVLRAGCILRQVRTWKLVQDEGLAMLVQVWRVWSMGEEGSTYK